MSYKNLKQGDVIFLQDSYKNWSWVAEVRRVEGDRIMVDDYIDLKNNDKDHGGFFSSDVYSRLATQEEKEKLNYDKYKLEKEKFVFGEIVEVSDDEQDWYKYTFVADVSTLFNTCYPIAVADERGVSYYRYARKCNKNKVVTKTEVAKLLGVSVENLEITEG